MEKYSSFTPNSLRPDMAVVPGDRVATTEEFLPGAGTIEAGGEIRSLYAGTAKFDLRNKRVSVEPAAKLVALKPGATVIGAVSYVRETMAVIDVQAVDGKDVGRPLAAFLRIQNSSPRYEADMYDVCRGGDVLRARVIDASDGRFQLTTAGRGLGVVLAYCAHCGAVLRAQQPKLKCDQCGSEQERRLAEDYGKTYPLPEPGAFQAGQTEPPQPRPRPVREPEHRFERDDRGPPRGFYDERGPRDSYGGRRPREHHERKRY